MLGKGLAIVALSVLSASLLPGCGGLSSKPPRSTAPPPPQPARSRPFVASEAVAVGHPTRLFLLPGLGTFSARCVKRGRAQISYHAGSRTSTQQVAWETRESSGTGTVDPGENLAARFGRGIGPRIEWHTGDYSKGFVTVATATFAVSKLYRGSDTCLITAQAELVVGSR